jgi:hypothetical protein
MLGAKTFSSGSKSGFLSYLFRICVFERVDLKTGPPTTCAATPSPNDNVEVIEYKCSTTTAVPES